MIFILYSNAAYESPIVYEPNEFSTEALRHSKVKLTWDDDDPDRLKVTRRKFTKEDLKNMDFQAYIASDEEDSEDDEPEKDTKNYYQEIMMKKMRMMIKIKKWKLLLLLV